MADQSTHVRVAETTVARRVPPTVLALACAQVLLSLAYALLTPAFQGPDESQHLDMAVAVADWEQWPIAGTRTLSREVRDSHSWLGVRPRKEPRAAEDAPDRSDRPSFEDLEGGPPTKGVNHINQHPPTYYASLNAWTGFLASASPVDLSSVDRTVFTMRAFGAVMAGGVIVLIWLIASRAGLGERASLLAAAAPLLVPMFTYIHSSVNNDALLPVLMAGVVFRLVAVLRGDLGTRSALLTGLLTGLTASVKFFGLAAVPMVLLALWWAPASVARRLRFAVVAGGVSFVSGGWWWLRNRLVEGTFQPSGFLNQGLDPEPDLATFLDRANVRLWQGFFGRFGNLNTPIERWVLIVLTVVVVVAVAAALVTAVRRTEPLVAPLSRRAVAVAVFPFAAILFLDPVRVAYQYATTGGLGGLQGRYTFIGMAGLAVVVGVGIARLHRSAAVVAGTAIVIGQLSGGYALLRRFWGVRGAPVETSLDGLAAWAPFSGRWTFLVLGLAAVTLVGAVVSLVWEVLRTRGRGTPGGTSAAAAPTATVGP